MKLKKKNDSPRAEQNDGVSSSSKPQFKRKDNRPKMKTKKKNNPRQADQSRDEDQSSAKSASKKNGEEESEDHEAENVPKLESKPKKKSDVLEKKTMFIRNLDFETSEEDVSELLSIFGELEYVKIVVDSYTGKSRGTGFAKFKSEKSAQACLEEAQMEANPKFYIDGRQLNVSLALPREQVHNLPNGNSNIKKKDKRNLYLAREGLIYPNSPAAAGVSQIDLKKRLALEEKKRKLLQNLHYFIADNRLCVHNLPPKMDDNKLREIFLKAANDKQAKILWAKVMRNRNKANEFGNSKGYGFVEFSEHAHALKALRALNNNPDIFGSERRPIVEFSVENLVALNRKKFRAIKQEKMKQAKVEANPVATVQEEQSQFSGVMTKPIEKKDKVAAPKMNRKMRQVKKDLRKRKKQLKLQKTREHDKERRQHKMDSKDNNIVSKKIPKKSKHFEVEDKYDQHLQKRKRAFLPDNNNNIVSKAVKKSKWFVQ